MDKLKMDKLKKVITDLFNDPRVKALANSRGLDVTSVSWEDTSRHKGSCWGDNITDMTLNHDGTNMPVIRSNNFADITVDRELSDFTVLVGNESGKDLKQITLEEYIKNINEYTGNFNIKPLLCDRDKHILTSAQACILPLNSGSCDFHVNMFNYQSNSNSDDPAILVIMASAQGTSCAVVYRNTPIYFNHNGSSYEMKAERLSQDRIKRGVDVKGPMTPDEQNRNALFIYQIPLKQKKRVYTFESCCDQGNLSAVTEIMKANLEKVIERSEKVSDLHDRCRSTKRSAKKEPEEEWLVNGFEKAVISQGKKIGIYYGTNNLSLERDDRYPIRCTVQFYNVTDTPEISEHQIQEIADMIGNVYSGGVAVGSLVLSNSDRVTESTKTETGNAPFAKKSNPLAKFFAKMTSSFKSTTASTPT